ncbi:MAG: general secretion pathway protein GspK [Candidatus Omnitrophica bacterium]|nr:general secretion pathway protein GspK [Candidatus Omnitrophota bacterium]
MRRDESGIILASVLWTMILLSLMALAIGRYTGGQAWYMANAVGRVKAYAAARSGMSYALNLLAHSDAKCAGLALCGIDTEGEDPESFFKNIKVGARARADIAYVTRGYTADGSARVVYGFSDEGRRVNLNAINAGNMAILVGLLTQAGLAAPQANLAAACAVNWADAGATGTGDAKLKKRPYDSVDELLVCEGMTVEALGRIREFLTVFPKESGAQLNFNSATISNNVALAFYAQLSPSASGAAAGDLMRQLAVLRDGPDGLPFTLDDGKALAASAFARQYPFADLNIGKSLWRVRVVGTDENTGMKAVVEAVVEKKSSDSWPLIKEWHRE